MVGINAYKVEWCPLLDLVHQVENKAIGRHVHIESTSESRLKVVVDENAPRFSDLHCCHDSSSWIEMKGDGEEKKKKRKVLLTSR